MAALNQFSIKAKLIAGFGTLSLIVVAVAGLSLKSLSDSTEGFSNFVRGINARADMAVQVRTAVDRRAIAKMDDQCRPLLAALIRATDAYADYAHSRQEEMIAGYAAHYEHQRNLLITISLLAIALAVGACVVLTRAVSGPLHLAIDVARTVSQGDLRTRINVNGKDETSKLLGALREMNERLTTIVGRVRDASTSIAGAAREIAAGNMDLSQRTEQQAASLQETASSMEQLTSTVKQNADNAQQGSTLAANASCVAQKGSAVVGQVVSTMQDISDSSTKIADITGIIEGIAFQTNILALNAAVEAARAGEQGRGFAVVASEVRSLAQRSSSAAKEIKDLIANSVDKIRDGSSLAGEAGKTMSEVTEAVAGVTDIMSEIAAASSEQSRGIEQVNLAITQMDNVTQQNAALVEEAAAASRSMEEQGEQLNEVVGVFRVLEGVGLVWVPSLQGLPWLLVVGRRRLLQGVQLLLRRRRWARRRRCERRLRLERCPSFLPATGRGGISSDLVVW
ncbi:methyl-accepting chemotaxis protein [Paraburkholderia caledonica]|uniref:methyl-accepting chemotaxis protein n=1 Tax=Paraburkholderia caledonica TaxID=134536 RepID=UPI000B0FD56B|nr:methyl-accepting chemotaxis protein [Paraburkholderia caledonica]